MKTPIHTKSGQNVVSPAGFRASGLRPNSAKTFEHRYERRKLRAQLRRLDWALAGED